jgi:COP9 signalosome complex subunit 4
MWEVMDIVVLTYCVSRSISDDYKLQIYIRIVRLLLEEDEAGAAEMYLNRAGLLILDSTDLVLNLTFKLSQARILDAKHRFLEACTRYHELSYVTQLDEDEQIQCL